MFAMTRKVYIQEYFVDIRAAKCHAGPAVLADRGNNRMNVLNEQMTRSETSNDAKVIALGEERVAAWARFYAIAADSTPG
jgi:hypothetical protein